MSAPETRIPLTSPYKGLAPFEDSDVDALLFFGRDWETEVVAANVLASRLTVLYGPSGVGKSSLLRAGVVRSLRKSGYPSPAVAYFGSWAGEPLGELEEVARSAVAESLGRAPADAPGGLTDRFAAWSAELGAELCLLVDQLEELFLYHPAKEGAAGFVDLLPELVLRPGLRVNVLLGIRDDALAQLDVFKERIPGLFMNSLRLDHLDRSAGRAAILGPLARFAGIAGAAGAMEIEPELVDEVLDEVAAGRIEPSIAGVGAVEGTARVGRIETPYLQLVLQRLWEVERERGSGVMTLETFRSLGGAERIVQDHLERAVRSLSPAEQAAAASVFGHLVTPSGSKIAHGTSDLATYAELDEREIKPVLDSLARQRILRPLGENGHAGGRYEIFHDVLAGAVLAWSTRHEADAALEEERKRRRRLGWLAAAALVGLALMAALAAYAFSQRTEAQKQSAEAQVQREAAISLASQRKEALDEARKAQQIAQDRTREAQIQRENAIEATADAKQQARNAQEANEEAQQQKELAVSGQKDAEEAREDAQAAQDEAEEQADLAEAATEKAKDEAEKATIASDAARKATIQARARLLIARSVLAVRSDPQKSADYAVRASNLVVERRDRLDAENALRVALVSMRLQHILPGAGADGARVARFSANGRRVVVAAGPRSRGLRIYRARDGRLLRTFSVETQLNDAALSPDGKLVAAAGADGRVWVWSADARTPRHFDHGAPVSGVAWSPSGDVLASVGLGANPSARLWATANGDLLHLLQHSAPLEAAIFSPDGRRVATYGAGHLVRIFEVKTGFPVSTLEHPVNALPVTSAAFGPGSDLIATSRGNVARLWEVETGVPRVTYQPHTRTVTDVAFSPTGERLVTASSDTIARTWTTATGALVTTTSGHTGLGINDVDFSPDDEAQAIVSAGADGTLRYSAPGQNSIPLLGHESAVLSASFGTDGRSILSASADGTARLWDPYGEPVPKTLKKYSSDVTALAVDPTGSRYAVGRDDGAVEVLSPGRRVISTPVTGIRRTVSVGWARETTLMAATSAGRVRIWGDSGRGQVRELLHGSGIRAAAISRDGKQVATAGQDGVVRLWRLPSATFRTLKHDAAVAAVAFDETGRLLASASGKQAFVWRTSDAERFRTLDPGVEADDVTGVAFGGKGLLATLERGGTARIWSFRSEKLVNTLIRHGGAIGGLSFSPDGNWLVTAGLRKAGVWQVGDSDLDGHFLFFVAPPRMEQGNLTSVVFSRNRRIVIGSTRGEGVPYGAVRSYRCRLCGRLPELVGIARGKIAHLQAEARR